MGCGLLQSSYLAFRLYNSSLSPSEISHLLRLIQSHGPSARVQVVIKNLKFATQIKKKVPLEIEEGEYLTRDCANCRLLLCIVKQ